MLVRALLLPVFPIPAPRIHDEFSHLLVADTFAHGRLVNPVHPLWVHFDSMHILTRPVYASIYPVAQGAIMAAAQVVMGNPWVGVWLSVGLMCAALCWMLQGWVSTSWALLGGMLAAARFGVFSYWMNSYYGGAIAAVGGALVLGALPRIYRGRRWQDAAPLGIGLVILANSRPYEGAVFSAPILVALLWMMRRKVPVRAVAVPLALILGTAGIAMGVYFARFSGNPFLLPYQFFRTNFTVTPHFIWQSPRPEPVFYHQATYQYYNVWERAGYENARANRPPQGVVDKAKSYLRFYLGVFLAIPLVAIPWLWKRRRTRFLILSALFFSAGLAVEVWHAPHYAAPVMGLMLLLSVEGLRHLRQGPGGLWIVRAIGAGAVLLPVVHGGIYAGDGQKRATILKQLEAAGGEHLVLVRYSLLHDQGEEWVYNSADIDRSRVVWAREMDAGSNEKLLRYFAARRVWLLEPDVDPVRLSAYDPSTVPMCQFRFARLGTPAIAALHSPEVVRRKVLDRVARDYPPSQQFNCYQWNSLFSQATGVAPPDNPKTCFPAGNAEQTIGFEEWFAWLLKQQT